MFIFRIFKEFKAAFWKLGARRASALILTMFIMSGMMLAAMSGAYVVFLGIRAGGLQAQSGRAYYAAESGAEYLLWRLRRDPNDRYYPDSNSQGQMILSGSVEGNGTYTATYEVYYIDYPPHVFQAVGDYQGARRSVELRL